MNESEFLRQQQAAVQRMREMNERAHSQYNPNHKMPPVPSFVKMTDSNNRSSRQQPQHREPQNFQNMPESNLSPPPQLQKPQEKKSVGGLNIPFLDMLSTDGDATLIIGLLLILMSENSDKILLFALIYILL